VSNTDRGTLFESAVAGMIYWFDNDFDKDDCMSHGGDDNKECPCDTPGLWNQNWFSNVLLIPQLVGTACLLIQPGTITQNITDGCTRIMQRGWDQRNDDSMQSKLTGANVSDERAGILANVLRQSSWVRMRSHSHRSSVTRSCSTTQWT
jgi:hypothetical protein